MGVRGSKTEGTVSAVGGIMVGGDPLGVVSGLEHNHRAQVRGSLVLEEVSVKEKATVCAGAGAPLAVGMVHGGGSQDDNSSESSQLKEPPEKLPAMIFGGTKEIGVSFRVGWFKRLLLVHQDLKIPKLQWAVHLVVPTVS